MTTTAKPLKVAQAGLELPNVANTDSKTLAWFEKGEVTTGLTITGSTTNPTSITYGARSLKWQRVDQCVTFQLSILISALAGGSGVLRLNGLPYAPSIVTSGMNTRIPCVMVPDQVVAEATWGEFCPAIKLVNGQTYVSFVWTTSGNVSCADVAAYGTFEVSCTGAYFIA